MTVAGGIRSVNDAKTFLYAGADKVGINTAAVKNPEILKEIASRFGNQCLVLVIDAKKISNNKWEVLTENGREKTGIDVVDWAKKANTLGIGEILLTSIDQDGTKKGLDINLVNEIKKVIDVPLIVSGGVGKMEHIQDLFSKTQNYNIAIGTSLHKEILKIGKIKKFF